MVGRGCDSYCVGVRGADCLVVHGTEMCGTRRRWVGRWRQSGRKLIAEISGSASGELFRVLLAWLFRSSNG